MIIYVYNLPRDTQWGLVHLLPTLPPFLNLPRFLGQVRHIHLGCYGYLDVPGS